MLKQRLVTAAILIALTLIILIYLPPLSFLIVTTCIVLGGAWEWTQLMKIQNKVKRFGYVGLILSIMLLMSMYKDTALVLLVSSLWWVISVFILILYSHGVRKWCQSQLLLALFGIIVLVPAWLAINFLRMMAGTIYPLLYLLILIWGADSIAYFIGKKWGTLKFAKHISPKKSVQGGLGALAFSVIFPLLTSIFLHLSLKYSLYMTLLSILTVFFSMVGDLVESMLKREANLKDSSQLLPGHGGILDRLDSLTAAAPIFVLGYAMFLSIVKPM